MLGLQAQGGDTVGISGENEGGIICRRILVLVLVLHSWTKKIEILNSAPHVRRHTDVETPGFGPFTRRTATTTHVDIVARENSASIQTRSEKIEENWSNVSWTEK
ncbi:uncharacterized protein LOC125500212 [Athalia rosae]|uniref:uncharacterized protein LOC125500212 n=1 Tax=Athalia rosae TaxID=37344 RepID=UPI00203367A8|nr:uncharacterized protein LOC125500212 [Athalia rosae]